MALSTGRRRALAVLAALPGLALAAWWAASDSYLDSWRARESALEARVALWPEVAALNEEQKVLRAEVSASIRDIRGVKACWEKPVPALDPLLASLPAEPRLTHLRLEPAGSRVELWALEDQPGSALALAEHLRAADPVESVILPPAPGEREPRVLMVTLTGDEP